jgi:hypothetical protein
MISSECFYSLLVTHRDNTKMIDVVKLRDDFIQYLTDAYEEVQNEKTRTYFSRVNVNKTFP